MSSWAAESMFPNRTEQERAEAAAREKVVTSIANEIPPRPASEAAAAAGVTYRQVHYWCTRGWVEGLWYDRRGQFMGKQPQGSGTHLMLSLEERRVITLMGRLIRVGLGAERAARVARTLLTEGPRFELGDGFWLVREEQE